MAYLKWGLVVAAMIAMLTVALVFSSNDVVVDLQAGTINEIPMDRLVFTCPIEEAPARYEEAIALLSEAFNSKPTSASQFEAEWKSGIVLELNKSGIDFGGRTSSTTRVDSDRINARKASTAITWDHESKVEVLTGHSSSVRGFALRRRAQSQSTEHVLGTIYTIPRLVPGVRFEYKRLETEHYNKPGERGRGRHYYRLLPEPRDGE